MNMEWDLRQNYFNQFFTRMKKVEFILYIQTIFFCIPLQVFFFKGDNNFYLYILRTNVINSITMFLVFPLCVDIFFVLRAQL